MRTVRHYLLILVAVACRGRDQGNAVPVSEPPPATTVTSASIDPKPSNSAPEPVAAAMSAVERRPSSPPSPPSPSKPPPPAAKAAAVPPRRGASASGPSFETWLETTGVYAPGANASVTAVVDAKPPYKCNTKYPYKLVLDPPGSGVSYPNSAVRGMRVDGKRATMPIPFVATSAGSHTVGGTLSFSTCTEDKCLVDKAHITVVVEIR